MNLFHLITPTGTTTTGTTTGTTTTGTTTTTTTTSTVSGTCMPASTPSSLGCYRDSNNRVLPNQAPGSPNTSSQTITACQTACYNQNYAYAGLETGSECWCGSSLPTYSDSGFSIASSNCNSPCTGATGTTCGGSWALNIYYKASLDPKACTGGSTTTVSAGNPTSTSTGSFYTVNGSSSKSVFSHFMVGNSYVSSGSGELDHGLTVTFGA